MGFIASGRLKPCKMWRTIAILFVAFVAKSQAYPPPAELDCRDFTFNRCDFSQLDDLVSTTFGEDDEYCQFVCNFLKKDNCKFWVYDYPNSKCDIYGLNSTTEFGSICHDHGGPSLPTIDDCKTSAESENKCKGYHYAQCDYKGGQISPLRMENENVCQIACEKAKDCSYYIYSPKTQVCELMVDKTRNCNSLIGPMNPALDMTDCKIKQNSVFEKLYYHFRN